MALVWPMYNHSYICFTLTETLFLRWDSQDSRKCFSQPSIVPLPRLALALGLESIVATILIVPRQITFKEPLMPSLLVRHSSLSSKTLILLPIGIILYVAFVQMLAIDFTRDVRRVKGFWRKGTLLVCLWVGAGIMALIGKWL